MSTELFVTMLFIISALTGLVTEAVKKVLKECGVKYHPNSLAGLCSIIVSTISGLGYTFYSGIPFDATIITTIVALILLSWLCSMVGYDKVIQVFKKNV